MKSNHSRAVPAKLPSKPRFEPIPTGSALLVDFANLIGGFKVEENPASQAIPLMESMEKGLEAMGFNVHFFIEHRTLTWVVTNQANHKDGPRFMELCDRMDKVTVVSGWQSEADTAILQTATALPNAVCISRDQYRDYAGEYPEIVGTARVRAFNIVRISGNTLLCIDGVKSPIAVSVLSEHQPSKAKTTQAPEEQPETGAFDEPCVAQEPVAPQSPEKRSVKAAPAFPPVFHNREAAIRVLAKAAKKDPENYFALADLYSSAETSEDRKLAAKYYSLGKEREKSIRQTRSRDQRRYAERRRAGGSSDAHLSAQRWEAAQRMAGRKAFPAKGAA